MLSRKSPMRVLQWCGLNDKGKATQSRITIVIFVITNILVEYVVGD